MKREFAFLVLAYALIMAPRALCQHASNSYQTELENIYKRYSEKAQSSDFTELYRNLTSAGKVPDSALRDAQSDEAQGRMEAATAGYLAAATEALNCGDFEKSKSLLDKVSSLGAKLDKAPKKALVTALVGLADTGYRFREQRNIACDYLLTMALMLKAQLGETDEQTATIYQSLGGVRGSESQFTAAIDFYKKAIVWYEANKKDAYQLQSCYQALASLYMKQGNELAATDLLQKTIDNLEKKSATGGLEAVSSLLRLKEIYKQAKKPEQAKIAQDRALNIVEKISNETLDKQQLSLAVSAIDNIKNSLRFDHSVLTGSGNPELERTLRIAYKLKLRSEGLNVWTTQYLQELCSYLEKNGKSGEALELFQSALKYAGPRESRQLRARYLELLKATNRTAEAAEVESLLKREREEQLVKAEAEAIKRLVDSRAKREVDPQGFVSSLMAAANYKLSAGKTAESLSLAREAFKTTEAIPAADLEDDYQSQFWNYISGYLARATTKADEQSASSLVEALEKLSAKRKDRYSSCDLSDLANHFTQRRRYADAEAFLKTVLDYRKKYRANDAEAQIEVLQELASLYQESEETLKGKALTAELLALKEKLYPPNDPRIINQKLTVVSTKMSEGKLGEAETLLAQLSAITNEGAGGKSAQSCRRTSGLSSALSRLADAYIANNQLVDGERVLKKAVQQNDPSESIWVNHSIDRLLDACVRTQKFVEAEDLIKFQLAQRNRETGQEDLSANRLRIRLAEISMQHARKATADGKATESCTAEAQAGAEFDKAIASIERNQGVNSSEAQDARRRRDKAKSITVDEKPSPVKIGNEISITQRRHRPDVANQDLSRGPDPLSFAIFGRSEIRLTGRASTWSYKSSQKPVQLLDSGGSCGSFGEIILEDQARAHGGLIARDVTFNQSEIVINDKIDADGNIPEPIPLASPPALNPKSTHKAAVIVDGEIASTKDEVTDLGFLTLTQGGTLTLSPGDYTATQLSLQSQCKLQRKQIASDNRPVRIFVGAKTDSAQKVPMRIAGGSSVNTGGAPAQFQIFYTGGGAVVIDEGATVNSLLYAPAALVNIGGTDTTIYGCVVADEVRVGGTARVVYDKEMPKSDSIGLK